MLKLGLEVGGMVYINNAKGAYTGVLLQFSTDIQKEYAHEFIRRYNAHDDLLAACKAVQDRNPNHSPMPKPNDGPLRKGFDRGWSRAMRTCRFLVKSAIAEAEPQETDECSACAGTGMAQTHPDCQPAPCEECDGNMTAKADRSKK